jgi:hypothetical protein
METKEVYIGMQTITVGDGYQHDSFLSDSFYLNKEQCIDLVRKSYKEFVDSNRYSGIIFEERIGYRRKNKYSNGEFYEFIISEEDFLETSILVLVN